MGKDSAARIELGRSFHQVGTVNEKVSESDFVPLWDGTVMRRSLRTQASRAVVLKLFTPSTTSENIWLSKYHQYDQH